ncbi:unnamed protein product [Diabrotica balteata]|uniref:Sulfakinin n=1 Tax=Diabrotica balteata TaxID=107213 RepID=A0A9N9T5T2_DIABA|nr:unnamed protein product [Diabrotica balteata]
MVLRTFCVGVFLITSFYLFTIKFQSSAAAPSKDGRERHVSRSVNVERYSRYPQYAKIKPEPFVSDFIVDEDDFLELPKRQQSSDDYGHLRFGRRNGEDISDDYGHMRFGRGGTDAK